MWTALISNALTLAVGVATGLYGWYITKLFFEKHLTAYMYDDGPVLTIDPSIRDDVEAYYNRTSEDRTEVSSMFRVKFQIKNTGFPPISDFKQPLSFATKEEPQLLNIRKIPYEPYSIDVSLTTNRFADGSTRTEFKFDLLNKGEYFLLECLFADEIEHENLQFRLSSPGLPRAITAETKPRRRAVFFLGWGFCVCAFLFGIYMTLFHPSSFVGLPSWLVALLVAISSFAVAAFKAAKRRSLRMPEEP